MKAEELKIDPFGILIGHTWCEVGLILDAINRSEVTRFVELGVHKGGLCALLSHTTEHAPNFHYLGIEIDGKIVDPTVRRLFHPLVVEQGLRELWIKDAHARSTVVAVADWIRRDGGPALIYCDGGDKVKEFHLYAPIIRQGDMIAVHDFDYGGYERAEIHWHDIERVVAEQHLTNLGYVAPYRISLWRREQ